MKKLTPREKQVLELISKGSTSKEIAKEFGLSTRTIDAHRSNIMRKYGARNCEQAVRIGIELGDVQLVGYAVIKIDISYESDRPLGTTKLENKAVQISQTPTKVHMHTGANDKLK